jgi:hypothetical protein
VRPDQGQASLELVAGIPALLLAGLVALQLLATAYTLHLADNSAEAGALAVAAGRAPEPAAREALPGWAREHVRTSTAAGRVEVAVRPPSPLEALSRALEVESVAWARPPDG